MENKLSFSVILPVYNIASYLERCVKTLLAQDDGNLEVIFVDDGSTDNSGSLCEQYAKLFKSSKVVHKKNGGLSSARNAGMDVADGKYISFIDPDDWVEEKMYSEIWQEISANKYPDIIKYNYYRNEENKSGIEVASCMAAGIYLKEELIETILPNAICTRQVTALTEKSYILSAWSHIYQADFLRENKLRFVSEKEIGSEDWLFNIQALTVADSLLVLNKAYYHYDLREGSLTQTYIERLYEKRKSLYQHLLKTIRESEATAQAEESLRRWLVKSFYYDLCANEVKRNPDKKSAVQNIKRYFSDNDFKECVRFCLKQSNGYKEKIVLELMCLGQARIIYELKNKKI